MNHAKRLVYQNEKLLEKLEKPIVQEAPNFSTPVRQENRFTFGSNQFPETPNKRNSQKYKTAPNELFGTSPSPHSQPVIPSDPTRFFSHFKSLVKAPPPKPIPDSPSLNAYYKQLNSTLPAQSSKIESILSIRRPITQQLYTSDIQHTLPPPSSQIITNPALYSIKFTHAFEKQSCEIITDQLQPQTRKIMKNQRQKQDKREMIIDLKEIGFGGYAQVVLERAEGLLVNSVVKNFGKVEVDEIREIPEEYEIKKKKQVKSVEINTDSILYPKQQAILILPKSWEIMKLEIQQQKARREKTENYENIMEARLLELLDYILEGEQTYRGLDYQTKIKSILKDIDKFKGKNIGGETKINLILYLFRQTKQLKDYIQGKKLKQKNQQRLITPKPVPPPLPPPQTAKRTPKSTNPETDKKFLANRKANSDKGANSRVKFQDIS